MTTKTPAKIGFFLAVIMAGQFLAVSPGHAGQFDSHHSWTIDLGLDGTTRVTNMNADNQDSYQIDEFLKLHMTANVASLEQIGSKTYTIFNIIAMSGDSSLRVYDQTSNTTAFDSGATSVSLAGPTDGVPAYIGGGFAGVDNTIGLFRRTNGGLSVALSTNGIGYFDAANALYGDIYSWLGTGQIVATGFSSLAYGTSLNDGSGMSVADLMNSVVYPGTGAPLLTFSVSTAAAGELPVPSPLALIGGGILAMAAFFRRRHSA